MNKMKKTNLTKSYQKLNYDKGTDSWYNSTKKVEFDITLEKKSNGTISILVGNDFELLANYKSIDKDLIKTINSEFGLNLSLETYISWDAWENTAWGVVRFE